MSQEAGEQVTPSPEQQAVLDRAGRSSVLVAAAGSGKTRVLTWLYRDAHIRDGIALGELLAITFTDKAAGELRERIAGVLRPHLLGAEPDLTDAWIGTFHATCTRILREFAHLRGLDPAFGVIDELEAAERRAEAWETAVEEALEAYGSDAATLLAQVGEPSLRAGLMAWWNGRRSGGEPHPALPRPQRTHAQVAAAIDGFARAAAAHGALCEEVAAARSAPSKTLDAHLAAVGECHALAAELRDALALGRIERDAAFADDASRRLRAIKLRAGRPLPADRSEREDLLAARDALAPMLHELGAAPLIELIGELATRFSRHYEGRKREAELLDFDDLELEALALLREHEPVRRRVAARFRRVFVDEFQDTNPRQAELVDLLAGGSPWSDASPDRAAVTAVGDPRQSIYGFRHADVSLIGRAGAQLRPGGELRLTTNYRSQDEILARIDDAFARLDPGHERVATGRDDCAALPGGAPRVELLITKDSSAEPWSDEELGAPAGEEGNAALAERRLVAARIQELRAAEPGAEIAVLARTHAVLGKMAAALGDLAIPVLADAAEGFWQRLEVADLMAWLRVVRNPGDDEALVQLAASPLLALGTDGLAALAPLDRTRRWDALRDALAEGGAFDPDDAARLSAAVALIEAQRDPARTADPAALIDEVVAATGYDEHLLRLEGGERRLANVVRLRRLAQATAAGGGALADLLDRAELEQRHGLRVPEAAVAGAGAVRLMTVHQAKGLEFATVFVVGLGTSARTDVPTIVGDAHRLGVKLRPAPGAPQGALVDHAALCAEREAAALEEVRRVLYVALTRAEERLVVSGVGYWKEAGQTAPFRDPASLWDGSPRPKAAGSALIWLAPALVPEIAALAATPGRHRSADGIAVTVSTPSGDVLGGDQRAPELRRRPVHRPPGPRPAAAAPAAVAPAAPVRLSYTVLSRHAECALRFHAEQVSGLRPLARAGQAPGAEQAAGPPAPGAPAPGPVQLDLFAELAPPPPAARPAGGLAANELGNLVHGALERLAPGASAAAIDAAIDDAAAEHELDIAGDAAGAARARELTAAALASPVVAELWAGGRPRRELEFTIATAAGRLLTGVVDAWRVLPDGAALIVDYKTDAVPADFDPEAKAGGRYELQRRIYALAALRAGAPAVRVVHVFLAAPGAPAATFRATRAELPMLDRAIDGRVEAALGGEAAPPPTARPDRFICADCPVRRGERDEPSRCGWARAATERHPDGPPARRDQWKDPLRPVPERDNIITTRPPSTPA